MSRYGDNVCYQVDDRVQSRISDQVYGRPFDQVTERVWMRTYIRTSSTVWRGVGMGIWNWVHEHAGDHFWRARS